MKTRTADDYRRMRRRDQENLTPEERAHWGSLVEAEVRAVEEAQAAASLGDPDGNRVFCKLTAPKNSGLSLTVPTERISYRTRAGQTPNFSGCAAPTQLVGRDRATGGIRVIKGQCDLKTCDGGCSQRWHWQRMEGGKLLSLGEPIRYTVITLHESRWETLRKRCTRHRSTGATVDGWHIDIGGGLHTAILVQNRTDGKDLATGYGALAVNRDGYLDLLSNSLTMHQDAAKRGENVKAVFGLGNWKGKTSPDKPKPTMTYIGVLPAAMPDNLVKLAIKGHHGRVIRFQPGDIIGVFDTKADEAQCLAYLGITTDEPEPWRP